MSDEREPVKVFSVVSWGCAGTKWLARALDSCPGIRCFHHLNGKIARALDRPVPDGVELARLLELLDLGHRAVGDVHGFTRTTIPAVRAAFGDRFQAAVLVRDPLPRYRSQLALFRRNQARGDGRRPWDVDYVKPLARSRGLEIADGDYAGWLVVHGANLLNAVLDEQHVGPIVRMEDVTSEPSALRGLVELLTGGSVVPDVSWAESAVTAPAGNRHAGEQDELSAYELDVVERIVAPEAWAIYRSLGYAC